MKRVYLPRMFTLFDVETEEQFMKKMRRDFRYKISFMDLDIRRLITNETIKTAKNI